VSGHEPPSSTSRGEYGDKYQDHVLELYKLSVELADRNTQRRVAATSSDVLLVANTLIAALAAAGSATKLGVRGFPPLVLGISGLLLCLAWAQRVRSYRALGAAKYRVITEIEGLLPLQPYSMEWEELRNQMYRRLSIRALYVQDIDIEFLLPWLFAILHVALIVVALIALI
jgi:hypothetical protein